MPTDADPFELRRFVDAQAPVHARALRELREGVKRSHWMWFVFPQLRGLGHSAMAIAYGLASLDEARAYLTHPVLGPRLEEATRAVLAHAGRPLRGIFGTPDDLKFRSSMTVFALAAGAGGGLYREAIDALCGGRPDDATLALLGPDGGWLRA
jgi:uncharacterized protein (DUF1810 family)